MNSLGAGSFYLRENLYNKLEANKNASLIGIFANSGFGKTVLMYSYLLHYNINNIWYGIDSSKELLPDNEVDNLIDKLNDLSTRLFIVFDNYHLMNARSDIHEFIERVIEGANPLVTIVIMGKQRPDFSLSLLKSKKRYYELDADDLAFSRLETEDYFNNYNNLDLKPYELDWVYEITQGWPASYQLILEYIQKISNQKRNRLDFHLLSNVPDIFDYLSNEVFECETEEIKDFMLETSLMTELEPEIVDSFLEIHNSEDIIRYLLENHAFVYKNEYGVVKYHKLFRQFLYERYYHLNVNQMSKLHNKLTEIYMKRYSYILAFAHAVASNDYIAATKIIKLIGHRYNAMQFINVIDGHLEDISPKLLFSNTSLFLTRCIPESILIEFIEPLNDAIHTAEINQNVFLLSNLQNRLGTIYYHMGGIYEAKEMFEKSYQNATEFNDYALIACNLQFIAECYICMELYEKSLEYARQALFISERRRIVIMQVHTLEVLTRLHIELRDYEQAEFYLSQSFESIEEEPFISFWLLIDKSTLFTEKKEYDAAVTWAKKAIDSVIEYSDGYDIALSYLALGNAYLQSGKIRQAEWSLNIAYESCLNCGYLHYNIVKKQLELYRLMEQADVIRSKEQELFEVCCEYKYNWAMGDFQNGNDQNRILPSDKRKLKISTLGSFRIVLDGREVSIKRTSSLRILQFLIANRNHKINKDIIIDTVFPGDLYDNANHFNVALSVLRKSLEPELKSGKNSKYILRTKECYQLCLNEIFLDIDEFDEVCDCIMKSKGVIDENLLDKFGCLYRGDFFEEYPYESFLEVEREKINVKYIHTLKHIAEFYKNKKDYLRSQDYYEKILSKEPYMEDIYFAYIDMLLATHAVFQAKNIAKRMINCMEKELNVPVKDKIIKLFDEYHFIFDS